MLGRTLEHSNSTYHWNGKRIDYLMDAGGKTTFTLILTLTSHQLKKGKLDMDQRAKCKNAKRIEFVFMILEKEKNL